MDRRKGVIMDCRKSQHVSVYSVVMLLAFALPAWAADDATIQGLQTDVSTTKAKTDDHDNKIRNLEGGLPAERQARIEADNALQTKINNIQLTPGPQGPVGPIGPIGPTGASGEPGLAGLDGLVGSTGPAGPTGPQGPIGPTGPTGSQGLRGDRGEQGIPGEPGSASGGCSMPSCPIGHILVSTGASQWACSETSCLPYCGLTVFDKRYGNLEWEKKTDDGGVHDKDNVYTWSNFGTNNPDGTAFTVFLAALNEGACYAGHCDWRLPTQTELWTIVDCSLGAPCVDPIFGPTQSGFYWSSSSYALDPSYAWGVGFLNGNSTYGSKALNYYVRAVRGGL